MASQVPVGEESRAHEAVHDGVRQIAPDLAYIRVVMVNVVLFGGGNDWVLVDAGVTGSKSAILSAAEECFGSGVAPKAIVLTHGHFDHVGVLEDLARHWNAPVYAHPLEHPYLTGKAAYPDGDSSVGGGLMAALSGLYPTRPVDVSQHLQRLPEDGTVPFMPGWRWIHTPGHSPGHVSLWRDSDRTLIAGDAFVTTKPESAYATAFQTPEIHGPPQYFTIDWEKSRASVQTLAALRPNLVVTGHGRAMEGEAMTSALERLAREFDQLAVPRSGRYVEHPALAEDGSAYLRP